METPESVLGNSHEEEAAAHFLFRVADPERRVNGATKQKVLLKTYPFESVILLKLDRRGCLAFTKHANQQGIEAETRGLYVL